MKPIYLKDVLNKHEMAGARVNGIKTDTRISDLTTKDYGRLGPLLRKIGDRVLVHGVSQPEEAKKELKARRDKFARDREEQEKKQAMREENARKRAAEERAKAAEAEAEAARIAAHGHDGDPGSVGSASGPAGSQV